MCFRVKAIFRDKVISQSYHIIFLRPITILIIYESNGSALKHMQHSIGYSGIHLQLHHSEAWSRGIKNLRPTQPSNPHTASTNQTNNRKIKFMTQKPRGLKGQICKSIWVTPLHNKLNRWRCKISEDTGYLDMMTD